jgi:hypothetical protein
VTHINIYSIIHVYHLALQDFFRTVHLFAVNAAHNANNVKGQQIFVLNAQIQVKIFLFQLEHVQIVVQQDNTLI